MITRKNPLLDTFIDVENGGEGVDTAIRKFDKEFDHVIEEANTTLEELHSVKEKVDALDQIDHDAFAKKSEVPDIVGGNGINVEITGKENKISVNIPVATSLNPDPGLMAQTDKIILENLRNTSEFFAGHVVNEDIHVPDWMAPQDIGKVLKLTESGAEWSMGTGPGEFEGVFSVNGQQGAVLLEGEGATLVSAETNGNLKISTADATESQSGLMSSSDKEKLNSIPLPSEEDPGKVLVCKEDGSLAWETQVTHRIGEIFAYAGTTAPIGAVECKGQAMSKKTHPDLFAVVGYSFGGSGDTFLLPDTYSAGRFLRSRSVLTPVGMEQGDAIRNITGSMEVRSTVNSTDIIGGKITGAIKDCGKNGTTWVGVGLTTGTNAEIRTIGIDVSAVVPTAEENRPVNISVMYCIQIAHGYTPPTLITMDEMAKEIDELKNQMKTHHIGEIFAYAGTTAPMGAVECKGQVMSKTVHPDLFAVIGYNFGGAGDTFHLPDTYSAGRFLRSRSGSTPIGTEQGDAIRNITGNMTQVISDANASGTGVFSIASRMINAAYSTGANVNGGTNFRFDASKVVPTAEENRPVNVSIMYCIQIAHGYINSTQVDVAALQQEVIELRNKVQYPPMFIQGFLMEYVDASTVIIKPGACRSADNKYNIELLSDQKISGIASSTGGTVHFYAVLHEDETVSIETYITTSHEVVNPPVFSTEKAKRRIGSLVLFISSGVGIKKFKVLQKGQAVEICYCSGLISNLSTTSDQTNTKIRVSVPKGIISDALIRLELDGSGMSWAAARESYIGLTRLMIPYMSGNRQVQEYYPFVAGDSTDIDVSCSGSNYTFNVYTCGYIDWRVD